MITLTEIRNSGLTLYGLEEAWWRRTIAEYDSALTLIAVRHWSDVAVVDVVARNGGDAADHVRDTVRSRLIAQLIDCGVQPGYSEAERVVDAAIWKDAALSVDGERVVCEFLSVESGWAAFLRAPAGDQWLEVVCRGSLGIGAVRLGPVAADDISLTG